ncbi:hypothetical protein DXG01_002058 [Tephrocybe rancida]|nr:hypothetical protein DXG01_002058 [Tephrocybe rancida]
MKLGNAMITQDIADASGKTYDFVIIGGGTAGLTLAARLSEDLSLTVAVLEAGNNTIDDALTAIPARYGGTSSTNFLAWSLPPAVDIDAFERLGNPGWNWDEFFRYSKKIEKFQATVEQPSSSEDRGITSGAVCITLPPHAHPLDAILQATFVNRGVKALDDPYKGDVNGTWVASSTIDPKTWTRSSAATAYLVPAQDRPNLTVFTQAFVSRIIFADGHCIEGLTATGVEFVRCGSKHILNARREVILSAGTIINPQILELSGIGRRDVLSRISVEVKLELPGVGENLQEHNVAIVTYELDPAANHQAFDLLQHPEDVNGSAQIKTSIAGGLRTRLSSYTYIPLVEVKTPDADDLLAKIEKEIGEYKNTSGIVPGLQEQLDIQLDILRSNASPDFEFAAIRTQGATTLRTALTLTHDISKKTPHPPDLELLVQGVKYIRSVAETEPLKSALVGGDLKPGPQGMSNEAIREYVKNTHITAGHALGTCSMLPRDRQGVVDPHLKVYGTKNLRVVDLSIIPLQIAAHTQAAAYVIGEKGVYHLSVCNWRKED